MDKPIIDFKGNKQFKSVYVIIFQNGEYFMDKLSKIIDSFLGNRFEIAQNTFDKDIEDTSRKIKDIKKVVQSTNSHLKGYIEACNRLDESDISKFQLYKLYLIKEKAIYETLNKMQLGHKFFIGAFWIPHSERKELNSMLEAMYQKSKIRKPQIVVRQGDNELPPTYIRVNEFTYPFQEITNTYGVPCYKEVNPSYFGIVTFPFLFGVMFGDICHGGILFLFSCFLCLQPKLFHRSALSQLVPYRYLLFLMGISALFCGYIYNDFTSIPVQLYESCYEISDGSAIRKDDCVYPFGVDYFWYISTNHLTFFNSLKMKISVILGVFQM